MAKSLRADVAVEQAGLAESRTKAQTIIMAGEIWLDDQRIAKPATPVRLDDIDKLSHRPKRQGYVGRGAEKLLPALEASGINPKDRFCMDVGASTGGFTEVLLQKGATKVWAIDVGYGQLHPKLRDHPDVVVREKTNFRHWNVEDGDPIDLLVMDVSFISIRKLLHSVWSVLKQNSHALLMVKPQFELGKDLVPRSGVVRDPDLVNQAVDAVANDAVAMGFQPAGRFAAGIAGAKGNTEIFLHLTKPGA